MYFEKFPTTFFTLDDRKTVQTVTNIFLRTVINDELKSNFSLFEEYDVKDGETPEILADKLYGSSEYHWIVLHMNDIVDPRYEWPLSTRNLIKYAQGTYQDIYGIHHYEDAVGNWVMPSVPNSTPISNFMHEDRINESKRRIKLLKPQYVEAVTREFASKLESINV